MSVRAVNPLYSKTVNTPVIITEKVVGLEISHNPDEVRAARSEPVGRCLL